MRDNAKDWTHCNEWKDNLSDSDYKEFLLAAISNGIAYSRKNVPIYIWFAFKFYKTLIEIFEELKIPFDKVPIIWKKQTMPISWARYKRNYEPCLYAGFGSTHTGKNSRWFGENNEKAVWEINTDFNGSYVHPTQKPIALAARAIKNSSAVKNIVLDLFGGSGSTLMACEQTNRICRIMEYETIYCEAIMKRWEQFTGRKAELIINGKT
ncbi:MAG: site-specific DNA-methyltransferase [Actinobacteria bacterium]|nr:site-specific DNA-methyltransferase [Actinomycetota bacterium]